MARYQMGLGWTMVMVWGCLLATTEAGINVYSTPELRNTLASTGDTHWCRREHQVQRGHLWEDSPRHSAGRNAWRSL